MEHAGAIMQISHSFDQDFALPVGGAVRVLLITGAADDPLATRLRALGGLVDVETELYAALSELIDDPSGYGLVVIDCDRIGGAESGEAAVRTLKAVDSRVPLILISQGHAAHSFPEDRGTAIRLRAPVSVVGLRVGYEHALRDRMIWNAA